MINKTGVKDNRKIKEFSPEELEKLWRAIETYEGNKKGKVEIIRSSLNVEKKKQITKVKKNKKGTIISYYVVGLGWLTKAKGIALASSGKIDAVVATSRAGNLFLRTRPSPKIVNLEDLG